MKLLLDRDVCGETFTLSTLKLVLPGESESSAPRDFGFVCEDVDRGLLQYMPLDEVKRLKLPGITAVPLGEYIVKRTWSPKFQREVLEVLNVPGFQGIRIHSGNRSTDTEGCLLPGLHRELAQGTVSSSRAAVSFLDAQYNKAVRLGEMVRLTITRSVALHQSQSIAAQA